MKAFWKYQVRYRLARALIHTGLWMWPSGRAKIEVSTALWGWRSKVDREVAERAR